MRHPSLTMGEGTSSEPQVGRQRIVARPRLLRSLDDSSARIKIIVAPAGYGKTTLAQQWLADSQSAWCVCSQAYADVAALASGLQSAVESVVAGSGRALLERLPVTGRADTEVDVLAGMLAEDLVSWPTGSWLVIDDYHAIAGARAAERFVEVLLLQTSLNLLVLTRRRPAWASSRRILYGEVFELDRTALAMTDDEARGLLADTPSDVEALISLAQGWPAVLALASMSGAAPPDLVTAPHLYNFFAEEIYRRIDRRTRRALCEMALYDVAGRSLALAALRPDEAERVIRVAIDRGFITVPRGASLEMHPLLRSFLERKLREESRGKLHDLVGRVARTLMQHELWDEAFSVIDRFEETGLLSELIESSLERMLSSGRSATLKNWMKNAPQTSPPVRLAAAELAFREGRFHESEALASLAVRDANNDGELEARAHIVAGRAAHAASREDEAFRCYQQARHSTASVELRRIAMHGELAVAIELELEQHAVDLLTSLGPPESLEPHDRVIYEDRKMSLEGHFGIAGGLEGGRAARQLLGFVADPVARSSFRNVLGYGLAVGGYYAEALEVTHEQLDEADRFRLDFVVPYALIVRALASGGLRDYAVADESLSEADERADFVGDPTARHITHAVRTRLFTAQGAFELALSKPLPAGDDASSSNLRRAL